MQRSGSVNVPRMRDTNKIILYNVVCKSTVYMWYEKFKCNVSYRRLTMPSDRRRILLKTLQENLAKIHKCYKSKTMRFYSQSQLLRRNKNNSVETKAYAKRQARVEWIHMQECLWNVTEGQRRLSLYAAKVKHLKTKKEKCLHLPLLILNCS